MRLTLTRRGLIAGAGLAGAGAVVTPAVAQKRRDWMLATTWPKELAGHYAIAQDLADTITELSGGRLTVTPQPGAKAPAPVDTLAAVADGIVQMGHGAPYFWAHEAPALQFVASLPFGLTPREAQGWLARSSTRNKIQAIYSGFNVHMIPAGNSGGKTGGWFRQPIRAMDDLRGKRLRIPGLAGSVLRAAGAEIVQRPHGAIADALATGTIDGTDWSGLADDLAFGLADTGARLHAPPWQEPGTVLDAFVNADAWADLPTDLQAVVETAAGAVTQRSLAVQQRRNSLAYRRMRGELGLPPPHEIPQETLNTLGALAGQVLPDIASQDEQSRRIFEDLTAYRRHHVFWAGNGANAFLEARLLPFAYADAPSH